MQGIGLREKGSEIAGVGSWEMGGAAADAK